MALARFGGLRTPSEPFSFTWGDMDWERNRLSVPSPRTEDQGKGHRVIPLFPLLGPYLEAAFDAAVFVMPEEYRRRAHGERGWNGANLRTTFGKVIRRAGVNPWPRLWQSSRASRESDLAQSFPLAVVAKWLGNTPSVARRHYVDPTDAAFVPATGWTPAGVSTETTRQTTQSPADRVLPKTTDPDKNPEISGVPSESVGVRAVGPDILMEAPGIEPGSRSTDRPASTCVAC